MDVLNSKVKLEVKNISKRLGGKDILKSVSFDVYDGEFLSFLGPSGCGKTTMLKILVGLLDLEDGQIYKDGKDITLTPPALRGMGIVFQNYALFENMTVFENVKYALTFHKEWKSVAKKRAMEMIGLVGLQEHVHQKVVHLSGGQQQRVAIARTLALNPDVILFDEPMSALDIDTRLVLRNEIKELQRKLGTTMIFVTHDQEEAFAMSDRIMVMDKGRVCQIGTPLDILENPADDFVKKFVKDNLKLKMDSMYKYLGNIYEK